MKMKKMLKKRDGFTLVEMLVVVAIIAILIAVSIPVVQGNLEKARNSTDMANVRAAKAAALIDFMSDASDKVVTGFTAEKTTVDVYYDASDGKIKASTAKPSAGYGKSTKAIPNSTADTFGTQIPKGLVIKLTVKNDGTISAVTWE